MVFVIFLFFWAFNRGKTNISEKKSKNSKTTFQDHKGLSPFRSFLIHCFHLISAPCSCGNVNNAMVRLVRSRPVEACVVDTLLMTEHCRPESKNSTDSLTENDAKLSFQLQQYCSRALIVRG